MSEKPFSTFLMKQFSVVSSLGNMLHLCIVNVSEVIIKTVLIKKKSIMAIRFRRVFRLCDPTNKEAGKKVYPVISYQYDTSATLDEFAKEIASASGVSEGETISVLKDFRTLLRKTLLGGRSVNIKGLGYFFLSAQSKGTEKAEDFTIANISGLRVCFRANSDIRLFTGTTTRSDGLKFKDLDHINDSGLVDDGSDGGETPDPDGGSGDDGETPDPAA